MIQIYRDGDQGAIKLTGTAEQVYSLQVVRELLEAAAAEVDGLIDDGWELEKPMHGGFGLIHNTRGH